MVSPVCHRRTSSVSKMVSPYWRFHRVGGQGRVGVYKPGGSVFGNPHPSPSPACGEGERTLRGVDAAAGWVGGPGGQGSAGHGFASGDVGGYPSLPLVASLPPARFRTGRCPSRSPSARPKSEVAGVVGDAFRVAARSSGTHRGTTAHRIAPADAGCCAVREFFRASRGSRKNLFDAVIHLASERRYSLVFRSSTWMSLPICLVDTLPGLLPSEPWSTR